MPRVSLRRLESNIFKIDKGEPHGNNQSDMAFILQRIQKLRHSTISPGTIIHGYTLSLPVAYQNGAAYFSFNRNTALNLTLHSCIALSSDNRLVMGYITGVAAYNKHYAYLFVTGYINDHFTQLVRVILRVCHSTLSRTTQLYLYLRKQVSRMPRDVTYLYDQVTLPDHSLLITQHAGPRPLAVISWTTNYLDQYSFILTLYPIMMSNTPIYSSFNSAIYSDQVSLSD